MSCYWNGSDQPRLLGGRHGGECVDGECKGCQPCDRPHCRVCGHDHSDGTCPSCLADTRETLAEIARMCAALPTEAVHRGIESEAMNLLGPVADPEARGHVEAAYLSGRLPEGWIEAAHGKGCPLLFNEACVGCAGGELHPLTVLGTWMDVYLDAFDHDQPERVTVSSATSYLNRNLTYAGSWPHVPFEDFARNLRACRAHVEQVLHDGEQRETGAPCMTCRTPLVREWGKLAAADGWRCPRCREWRSENEYRLNVAALHRQEADWLTDREMQLRTGIASGTVRVWATRGYVNRKRESSRTVYAVADVMARAQSLGLLTATRVML